MEIAVQVSSCGRLQGKIQGTSVASKFEVSVVILCQLANGNSAIPSPPQLHVEERSTPQGFVLAAM